MAKALHNAIPRVGEECYIYVLEMNLVKAVTGAANPKNRRIINPLDTEFCFGFLSNKKIPKVGPDVFCVSIFYQMFCHFLCFKVY